MNPLAQGDHFNPIAGVCATTPTTSAAPTTTTGTTTPAATTATCIETGQDCYASDAVTGNQIKNFILMFCDVTFMQ